VVVTAVDLRDFRSYARQELELPAGLTVLVGPNGAGKTNLLEAIHVGTQGASLKTRRDVRVVRFGATAARVRVRGRRGRELPFDTEVTIQPGDGKRIVFNGALLAGSEELRKELPVLAFTPDRLAVVKGGPLVRRTYLDRMVGRVFPPRAELPAEYGQALAQRNAALRRLRSGFSNRAAAAPWTEAVVRLGNQLDETRAQLVRELGPLFVSQADRLGLAGAALVYEPRPLSVSELDARLDRDVERGVTGAGPHLRDVAVTARGRELRVYGSQGEQRLAVLALLLAEADVLADARGEAPLLLLDDVLSELDDRRRAALLAGLPAGSQALVTATTLRSLPDEAPPPALVVDVTPGRATPR